MFERKTFKKNAKEQLKGRWKIPVLTTLLIFILVGILYGAVGASPIPKGDYSTIISDTSFAAAYNPSKEFSFISILISCIAIVFEVAQLSVCNTMYIDTRKIYFSDFINGLNQWWQAIRGGLWFMLWVWLWSLLFVIPGIVKSYAYSQMFFIMAEYPKIGVKKAMNLSKELTRGYKGELFVLDLSFIGWALLATITCGIGYFWLVPYINMTKTNAYQYLKQTALSTNRVHLEDFE